MSAETKAALESAIQAHVDAEQPGFLVGGYALETYLVKIEDDGMHHYAFYRPSAQPYHSTLGLLQTALSDFEEKDNGNP